MRKPVLFWLCLAAICGGVLFHVSQKVTDGRQQLAVIEGDLAKERESSRVLTAEWSYLNRPERLEKLNAQYLHLVPTKGSSFVKLSDAAANVPSETSQKIEISKTDNETSSIVAAEAPLVQVDTTAQKPLKKPQGLAVKIEKTPAVLSVNPVVSQKPESQTAAIPAKQRVSSVSKKSVAATANKNIVWPLKNSNVTDTKAKDFDDLIKNLGVE